MRVVTIGYEGRTIEELLEELGQAEVDAVVDVRQTPVSRKVGFSKGQLASYLEEAGIVYIHEKTLGNPKDNRDGFRKGDPVARDRFRRHLEAAHDALARLTDLLEDSSVALLCYERSHSQCHRESVADAILSRRPDTEILTV